MDPGKRDCERPVLLPRHKVTSVRKKAQTDMQARPSPQHALTHKQHVASPAPLPTTAWREEHTPTDLQSSSIAILVATPLRRVTSLRNATNPRSTDPPSTIGTCLSGLRKLLSHARRKTDFLDLRHTSSTERTIYASVSAHRVPLEPVYRATVWPAHFVCGTFHFRLRQRNRETKQQHPSNLWCSLGAVRQKCSCLLRTVTITVLASGLVWHLINAFPVSEFPIFTGENNSADGFSCHDGEEHTTQIARTTTRDADGLSHDGHGVLWLSFLKGSNKHMCVQVQASGALVVEDMGTSKPSVTPSSKRALHSEHWPDAITKVVHTVLRK